MYAKGLVARIPFEHGEAAQLGKGLLHIPFRG
jgi:hypothetical protein